MKNSERAVKREHGRLTPLAKRLLAYAIDVGLIFLCFVLTQQFLFAQLRSAFDPGWMRSGYLLELYTLSTISAPAWIYLALSESSRSTATVGKRLVGLKVRDEDGRAVSFGRALLRAVSKCLPWEMAHAIANVPTPMWIDPATGQLGSNDTITAWRYGLFAIVYAAVALDVAPTLWTKRMQSGHDLVSRTVVES